MTCSIGAVADIEGLTERERIASEFADRFARNHHSIDDEFMAEDRTCFSDVEVIELTARCAMTVGNGRFLEVLNIAADDDGFYLLPEGAD